MIPTKLIAEQKFAEFNALIFQGKLPQIPIYMSNAKGFLGKFVFSRKRSWLMGEKISDLHLRINTRYDMSERELEDTIIHEMIHYYIGINQLNDTSAHGQIFRRIMDDINVKYGRHLTITHKVTKEQREQAYDKRQRWHVVAVVEFKDGKTGLKVLPRIVPRILNYYNNIGAHDRVSDIKLYMSNDIFFNRFPNSGALNATYVDAKELQEHLSDAKKLLCDGKQIRKI